MAITKKAVKPAQPVDQLAAFIDGADVKKESVKRIKMIGNKAIISVSLAPEMLAKLDGWAKSEGVSRSAAIIAAIKKLT